MVFEQLSGTMRDMSVKNMAWKHFNSPGAAADVPENKFQGTSAAVMEAHFGLFDSVMAVSFTETINDNFL